MQMVYYLSTRVYTYLGIYEASLLHDYNLYNMIKIEKGILIAIGVRGQIFPLPPLLKGVFAKNKWGYMLTSKIIDGYCYLF